MSGFIGQVAALWELADVCEESVRPRENEGVDALMRDATEESLSGLADDVKSRIGQAGMDWIAAMQDLPQDQIGIAFGLPHGSAQASAAAERAERALSRLLDAYPDIGHAATFLLGFLDAITAVSRVEVMYESIVTASVSALHTQLRAILVTVEHERRPQLGEEALLGIVEGVVNGGLPKWEGWLRETFGTSLPGTADERVRISEVFQQRNLFVHHGGAVSTRYAGGVASAPPIGSRVSADAQ